MNGITGHDLDSSKQWSTLPKSQPRLQLALQAVLLSRRSFSSALWCTAFQGAFCPHAPCHTAAPKLSGHSLAPSFRPLRESQLKPLANLALLLFGHTLPPGLAYLSLALPLATAALYPSRLFVNPLASRRLVKLDKPQPPKAHATKTPFAINPQKDTS